MNAGSKNLLSAKTLADTDGNAVGMRDRAELVTRQWHLTIVGNETGILTWVQSPTGKAITVSEGSLVLSTNTQASTQKLTIQRINSGTYCGLYKIMYGGKYVATSSSSSRYPTLTSTLNEYAVWSFMAEDKWCADVYDFDYPSGEISDAPTNSTLYSDTFLSVAEELGYDIFVDRDAEGNIINYNTNAHAEDAYDYMQSITEIMIYRGHGAPGLLVFGDENGLHNGFLTAFDGSYNYPVQGDATVYSIDSLDENALAHMRCVIYNGCETGLTTTLNGTDYNLVDATYDKGAHFVLGVTEILPVVWEEEWFRLLITHLDSSYSVGEAVEKATMDFSNIQWAFEDTGETIMQPYPYYAKGDGHQYLSFN